MTTLQTRFLRARRAPAAFLSFAFHSVGAATAIAGLTAGLNAQTVQTPPHPATSDTTVTLTPFEVSGNKDQGYNALNSNSITAFNTELNKLPVSADIFDSQFMQDIGATSVEAMIQTYSAGAGAANTNPGSTATNSQAGDRNANSFISLRGLTAPTMQRDGLMPVNTFFSAGSTGTGFTSSFDTERVDVISGPQALLYGVGGAGGVVNIVSKQARLGQPAFGDTEFQVDQFGHKLAQLDYGMGNDTVAIRLALTDQEIGNRRVNIGGPMTGDFGQIAIKLFSNTIVRIEGEQTVFHRQVSSTGMTLSAVSTATDARNADSIHYLLATNQLQSASNGAPSGAGYIGNGAITWDNVDSFAGDLYQEYTRDTWGLVKIETKWNDWLSTEISGGYRNEIDDLIGAGPTLLAPNLSSNPTGTWGVSEGSLSDLYEPFRSKYIRASAIMTNELFNGRAHSQTVLGADYVRTDGDVITYNFVKADGSFNPVLTGSTATNGYTLVPTQIWGAPNGPIENPLYPAFSQRITLAGVNYVRLLPNDTVSSLISPANPLGLTGTGSGDHRIGRVINKGIYLANYTDWMGGKLTSLLGMRVGDTLEVNQLEAASPSPPSGDLTPNGKQNHGITSFNAGLNYALLPWLRPYVEVSDSFDPPAVDSADPYGNSPAIAHGVGEEAGFKVTTADSKYSGSLAIFHTDSKNEQYSFTSTLTNDINPAGLNGRFGAVSNFINVDRETQGTAATFTAVPTPNWRVRLSAAYVHGTISTAASYAQLYNDQFYANTAGQVTYADGDVVYVAPTYNAKNAPLAAPAASAPAGYVPLTIAMMNSSTSTYYANPAAITASISSSSGVAAVLRTTEPGTGSPILTGRNGLPISALQIAPLASSPPVGTLVVAEPGDVSSGFPEYSFSATSLYVLTDMGWFSGFGFGGTAAAAWRNSSYYFYPNGTSQPNSPRIAYYAPMLTRFDGIFNYRRKFRTITFTTQVNINNMFNHYHVEYLPNAVTGYTGVYGATFDQQPRIYTWSNTISF